MNTQTKKATLKKTVDVRATLLAIPLGSSVIIKTRDISANRIRAAVSRLNKSQCELYKIRHKSGMYWADITLDYEGNTGRIQIASYYGSWQNYWGACGSSFKEFLTKLEMEYTATKFGADDWFDLDATLKSMRSQIKHHQKEWGLSKADAKELLDTK